MKYMGSKARFVKELLPIILQGRTVDQYYVEPFAGGMNMVCEVKGKRIANDNNKYLIEMWKGLVRGKKYPRDISRILYNAARNCYNKHTIDEYFTVDMIGWIGWMGSFNGRFFDGGYSGIVNNRDYINEQINNTLHQLNFMRDVLFLSTDYQNLSIPPNSIIYCDPPYYGTKQYSTSKNFNHDEFWQWCRDKSLEGHIVYISEYNAPDDFICVWEINTKSYMKPSRSQQTIEKLFVFSETYKTPHNFF